MRSPLTIARVKPQALASHRLPHYVVTTLDGLRFRLLITAQTVTVTPLTSCCQDFYSTGADAQATCYACHRVTEQKASTVLRRPFALALYLESYYGPLEAAVHAVTFADEVERLASAFRVHAVATPARWATSLHVRAKSLRFGLSHRYFEQASW